MTSFPVDAPVDVVCKTMRKLEAAGTTFSAKPYSAAKYSGKDCGYAQGYASLVTAKYLLLNGKSYLRGTI